VNDKKTSVNEKYGAIKEAILGVRNLGDTWVKMLMVCVDICLPKLGLLRSRCEVGVGAADPMSKLLVEEGLLQPPRAKVETGLEGKGSSAEVKAHVFLKAGIVAVQKSGVQLVQVTMGMAGSLDKAYAVAEELTKLAAKKGLERKDQEVLVKKRQDLFSNASFKVPKLGLDAKRQELLENGPAEPRKREGPSPSDVRSEALMALGARINESKVPSARHFWKLLAEVEAHGRSYFKALPLVTAQMKTKERFISAVTLQVQLCEFRQFESFLKRSGGKRPLADGDMDEDGGKKGPKQRRN